MIVLAAYPWHSRFMAASSKDSCIGFLAGDREVFVSDGTWKRSILPMKQHYPKLTAGLVPEADHFFMLTHADFTAEWLSQFIGR